jgi:hypothetical protein
MKRSVPLLITALGGFVLIVAYFIPFTQGWGEVAAIWFDILAAIAFVLGGGNLLKIHLKKVSDRVPGFGYSIVTLLAFLTMLFVGLGKIGAPPAPNQEFYGELFAPLDLEDLPPSLTFSVDGTVPERADGRDVHHSVRSQIRQEDGRITFNGWMRRDQRTQLLEHADRLDWSCAVDRLFDASQPAGPLAGAVAYYADHDALAIKGRMTDEQRDALLALGGGEGWSAAVGALYEQSQEVTQVTVQSSSLPAHFDPASPPRDIGYDAASGMLSVTGPMSAAQREQLAGMFPVARPMDAVARADLLGSLRGLGDITAEQERVFNMTLDTSWTAADLRMVLDAAGDPEEVDKTSCQMRDEQLAGVADIDPKETVGPDLKLNEAQVAELDRFAADPAMSVDDLAARLQAAGELKGAQIVALRSFMSTQPTVGQRDKALAFALMRAADADDAIYGLSTGQQDLLLAANRDQLAWRRSVGELFIAAHEIKFPWSGEYRAQGSPFWWLYEYAFKPLQATIFAMLAFYVASAAFRAFRAKNVEALLLLGTAFIILLGRTFAGVYMTAWLPEWLSGLRIENMTKYIMSIFNTAGNRAIMIGIALGIASTSLKVLLGVDRSYLGSAEE